MPIPGPDQRTIDLARYLMQEDAPDAPYELQTIIAKAADRGATQATLRWNKFDPSPWTFSIYCCGESYCGWSKTARKVVEAMTLFAIKAPGYSDAMNELQVAQIRGAVTVKQGPIIRNDAPVVPPKKIKREML